MSFRQTGVQIRPKDGLYAMIFREHLPSWGQLLDIQIAYDMGQMVPPK